MIEMSLMSPSKETDNKLRWEADVDGVSFKLYIPKWRVPTPWPKQILVTIKDQEEPTSLRLASSKDSDPESPISAIVRRVAEHSETARFAPLGDQEDWQIGEPYIPYKLLPSESVQTLRLDIAWDRSGGVWSEN